MFQHQKIVCGSLFIFLTTSTLGCAGNGIRNLFSKNDTDGYHTLEELEANDRMLAEDDDSEDQSASTSLSARLASWRPFAKPDANDNETDTDSSDDSKSIAKTEPESSRPPRGFGLPFTGRHELDADPFLDSDPVLADGRKTAARNTTAEKDPEAVICSPAKDLDSLAFDSAKSTAAKNVAPNEAKKSQTPADEDFTAVALAAKSDTSKAASSDDDLARRFEQHFLLNSGGAIAKAGDKATVAEKTLKQETDKAKSRTVARQSEVTRTADRNMDSIDQILAADNVLPTARKTIQDKTARQPESNSLAAFDRLLGTEKTNRGTKSTTDGPPVSNTVAKKASTANVRANVEVSDADTLFGAAAARQQARFEQHQDAEYVNSRDVHPGRATSRSMDSENAQSFGWSDSASEFAAHYEGSNSQLADRGQNPDRAGRLRTDRNSFGAPPAGAGNVDEAEALSLASTDAGFGNDYAASPRSNRVVTANYGSQQGTPGVRQVSQAVAVTDGTFLAVAPASPISEPISVQDKTDSGTRSGLLQSLSARNWLLLLGGIIIIALLFAPGRTKPVAING